MNKNFKTMVGTIRGIAHMMVQSYLDVGWGG